MANPLLQTRQQAKTPVFPTPSRKARALAKAQHVATALAHQLQQPTQPLVQQQPQPPSPAVLPAQRPQISQTLIPRRYQPRVKRRVVSSRRWRWSGLATTPKVICVLLPVLLVIILPTVYIMAKKHEPITGKYMAT